MKAEISDLAILAICHALRSFLFLLPNAGNAGRLAHLCAIYVGAVHLTTGLHAWMPGTLPTEPFLSSLYEVMSKDRYHYTQKLKVLKIKMKKKNQRVCLTRLSSN